MTVPDLTPRRRRVAGTVQEGRSRAMTVLAVVAGVLALGLAVDVFAAAAPPEPIPPLPQEPASAGSWFCPAVAGDGEEATLTIAAVGDTASNVIVDRYTDRKPTPDKPRTIEPGGSAIVELTGKDAQAPIAVRWTGGPAVAAWRVDGDRTASAACEAAPAETWHLTGFNAVRGNEPILHLFNPFTADAVVRLVFGTTEGREALALTENVPVGAGGTTSINLRKYMPEEPDLAVTVEVLSGRVVAQGEQSINPPGEASGAAGRLLLGGSTTTSESWSFAYAADGDGTESWLSVFNPGDDIAAVQFRVSEPSNEASSFVGEVSVPPGGVSRIELAKVSRSPEFGVTVAVVNSEPVVVSRFTALASGGGVAVTGGLGAPATAERSALVGGGSAGRAGLVSVYNPGPDPATVDLIAQGAPGRWSGVTLGPNERTYFELGATGDPRRSVPVLVSSDLPIVADLRSRATGGGALRLWVAGGVPEAVWIGPETRPAVRRNSWLATHAGKAPATEDPLLPELDPAFVPESEPGPAPRTEPAGG